MECAKWPLRVARIANRKHERNENKMNDDDDDDDDEDDDDDHVDDEWTEQKNCVFYRQRTIYKRRVETEVCLLKPIRCGSVYRFVRFFFFFFSFSFILGYGTIFANGKSHIIQFNIEFGRLLWLKIRFEVRLQDFPKQSQFYRFFKCNSGKKRKEVMTFPAMKVNEDSSKSSNSSRTKWHDWNLPRSTLPMIASVTD